MGDAPILVVDLGVGNLHSVERALRAALGPEADLRSTADAGALREAHTVVVPGQGAFGDCARALTRDREALATALRDHIAAGKRYLGICLGLQVLFATSEEAPGCEGLGVLPGSVRRFTPGLRDALGAPAKIPHMGWNLAAPTGEGTRWLSPGGGWFYFVHSYHVVPEDPSVIATTTTHGASFVSAVARGPLLGVQFHPEKSAREGLGLLRRFLRDEERAS